MGNTSEINCPYCGRAQEIWEYLDDMGNEDEKEVNCAYCEKPFKIIFECSVEASPL